MAPTTIPIPGPPGLPFLGNMFDLDMSFMLGSQMDLAAKYGEIFTLRFPGQVMHFICTQALVHEVCDEKRFKKIVSGALHEIRNGVHDGLFTAQLEEPNWGIAHRVLMPAFGPMSIQAMFPEMHEIASQLALKWARHGPTTPIMVTEDFTRLTLDTLALCSMNFRFNSYYHDEMHPFITAMGDFLTESGGRSMRPPLATKVMRKTTNKYWNDIKILRETAEAVLKSRKEHPSDRKDLMTAMLDGVDPKTGQKLSDASIIDNLITFLIAGHETTSGLLSFAFYQLLKRPEAYRRAQKEVDDVVGTGTIRIEHMKKLPYISAILRETLRVCPTISLTAVNPIEDGTILGGKYVVNKNETIALFLAKSQVDPVAFGDDADQWIPERMLDEAFEKRNREFPDNWKPFGNGLRGCIGRPFAWQESLLVMAVLLQNFNFVMHDPNYTLQYHQTLTTKPKDFYMRAILRHGQSPTELEHRLSGGLAPPTNGVSKASTNGNANGAQNKGNLKPLSIFYGSNTGTCETLAQRLAADAPSHGFVATTVDAMDAANQKLPKDQPVVIITASYEGQPPSNAGLFVGWLEGLKGSELDNVAFAVYGCGHKDWTQTFHRVPSLVNDTMAARGGERICEMGLTDASQGEMFTDFEQWEDEVLWPAMEERYGTSAAAEGGAEAQTMPSLSIQFTAPRSTTLRQDVQEAVVVETKDLTAPGGFPKKHIEIELPEDMAYRAGDYLAVLPVNPKETINRAMRRFQLARDANITIEADRRATLPTNGPVPAYEVLGSYVELANPATKRGILALAEAATSPSTISQLQTLATSLYTSEISRKRVSILDLLEKFPTTINLPFGAFLALLPPMRVRQYSISSSPLANPRRASLTYSLLDSEASLANPDVKHVGVATSYLASLAAGDKLAGVSVRKSHAAFHLPADPQTTPIVCIAAGAGIAPFRGFIQERAAQIATGGRVLAPALLFFGCRAPGVDDLYREELDRWEEMGAVSVRRAFSRLPETKKRSGNGGKEEAKGCRHVDDRLWYDRKDLMDLWDRGAKVYVCGSRGVGESVKGAFVKMALERMEREPGFIAGGKVEGSEEERALKWFDGIRNERYATDVFD
ncbi:putative bifunctional P-450:NADPH-P450 reductase [Podospora didyma]|uniref:Bifunctional cytochrome P450/NADPH--P450 reductase n=1 Tax=Podospora didyma TaxID=330526 RepID=A0AAE0P171_9PEZI|nr:putative bifunctional P-450:NADPH-P450 reductase [Podospora didyma]